MFVAIRISRRSSRSTKTPATAENSTAGTRKVRISALTAVFDLVELKTMTVSPKRTMLPPIWVAACGSQSRRNGRVLEDGERRPRRRSVRGVAGAVTRLRPSRRGGGRGATAALSGRVAALDETGEAAFERAPVDQHVTAAALAAEADVGAEPVDEPGVAAAGMGCARDGRCRRGTARARAGRSSAGAYQSRGWPWLGTRCPGVAGRVIGSIGVTVMSTVAAGLVAASWAMIPPAGSASRSACPALPIARISNGSRSRGPLTERARVAGHRRPRDDPDAIHGDRLGARVPELVQSASTESRRSPR